MKSMFAFRKESKLILVDKLIQANGTISAIFQATNGPVEEDRESINEDLLNSGVV
jgi:hypothetical protein